MVYFWHTTPITHSMWILRCASFLVVWTSVAESWLLPLVNAGIFTSAHIIPTLFCMSKPQSESRICPGISLLRRPQFSVKCLSLNFPPQPLDNERDCSLWTTANQELYCVAIRPGLCSSWQIGRPVHKHFETVYVNSNLSSEDWSTLHWHGFPQWFPIGHITNGCILVYITLM